MTSPHLIASTIGSALRARTTKGPHRESQIPIACYRTAKADIYISQMRQRAGCCRAETRLSSISILRTSMPWRANSRTRSLGNTVRKTSLGECMSLPSPIRIKRWFASAGRQACATDQARNLELRHGRALIAVAKMVPASVRSRGNSFGRLVVVDAVNPAGLWSPFGAFSMAVIQGDGQVVHLKCQVAL